MDPTLDRFFVSNLPERYSITKTALFERMDILVIKPQRWGGNAYVSSCQLSILDDLDIYIKNGGAFSDFNKHGQRISDEQSKQLAVYSVSSPVPSVLSGLPTLIKKVFEFLVDCLVLLFASLQASKAGMCLAHLRELEEAYEKCWLLSTSEISDLLSLSASTVRGYGNSFEEAGFIFTRAGNRSRGEIAWKISKIEN